ncbi:unnamed protein product, partial [Effrenium voratum]
MELANVMQSFEESMKAAKADFEASLGSAEEKLASGVHRCLSRPRQHKLLRRKRQRRDLQCSRSATAQVRPLPCSSRGGGCAPPDAWSPGRATPRRHRPRRRARAPLGAPWPPSLRRSGQRASRKCRPPERRRSWGRTARTPSRRATNSMPKGFLTDGPANFTSPPQAGATRSSSPLAAAASPLCRGPKSLLRQRRSLSESKLSRHSLSRRSLSGRRPSESNLSRSSLSGRRPSRKHPEQKQPERTPPERKHPEQKQPERTPLERKQAEQKQPLEEVKEPARRHDVLAVSGDFASIDVRACRRTLQALLAELPTPRCAISQLALATADQLLSDAGESDEGVAFAKLTAAGSVLDLMAVMNKCSHLLKVSLAVRGVLSAVAVLQEEWLLQPLLEPVVAPAFLAATAAQAATAPLPGGACELLQHCALLACDESEHSQRLLCAASCGFLNVCRALAMEAAYSQADRLLLQEAQCRVRAAAAKAARAAAAELKSELAGEAEPSTSAKPTGRESAIQAAVDAAASEADRQCKELDALRGEILSGNELWWDSMGYEP